MREQVTEARRREGTKARREKAAACSSPRASGPSGLRAFAIISALLALSGTGCQSAKVSDPLTASIGGNDPGEQVEFWHRLAERPVTSNDEAFHGLLLFLDDQDPAKDYAGRVAELKRRKMLPGGFDAPATEAVERGTLAVALVRALDIHGGVMMRLLGPTPRYATKELQFTEVFPPSSSKQTFSGSEFLGIISRAENYQERRATGVRAAEDLDKPGGSGRQSGAGVQSEVRPEMEPAPGPARSGQTPE
jgi:hypothetical protein